MSRNNDPIFLKGKRLSLRPVLERDLPLFTKWANDEDVRKFAFSPLPFFEGDARDGLERVRKDKEHTIALMIVTPRTSIGIILLQEISGLNGTATTTTIIGERTQRGKGLGTEAKMLLLYHAFCALNLRKVNSSILATNVASLRFSERCGYKEIGRRRAHVFRPTDKGGEYVDEVLLEVFKDDWLPLWQKFNKGA